MGHFLQNTKIRPFSTYHDMKTPRAFNPSTKEIQHYIEIVAIFLPEMVGLQREA